MGLMKKATIDEVRESVRKSREAQAESRLGREVREESARKPRPLPGQGVLVDLTRTCNRCNRTRPQAEGVCACGCPEFRLGRDPLPAEEVIEPIFLDGFGERSPLLASLLEIKAPPEPPDVEVGVVVKRRRRTGPKPGQMTFLDTGDHLGAIDYGGDIRHEKRKRRSKP